MLQNSRNFGCFAAKLIIRGHSGFESLFMVMISMQMRQQHGVNRISIDSRRSKPPGIASLQIVKQRIAAPIAAIASSRVDYNQPLWRSNNPAVDG